MGIVGEELDASRRWDTKMGYEDGIRKGCCNKVDGQDGGME